MGFRAIGASGLMSVDRLASLSGNASYRLEIVAEIWARRCVWIANGTPLQDQRFANSGVNAMFIFP